MNFHQKINLRNTLNKILKLKNRYKSKDNLKRKIIGTEPNQENISKEKNKFLIQCTDKLSLINRTWDRKSKSISTIWKQPTATTKPTIWK